MEALFAERAKWIKASEVRELLKYAQDPRVISFGGGLPSPDAFPLADLGVIFEELVRDPAADAFQYGLTQGDLRFREALTVRLQGRGVATDPARIIVTHGAQQAIELLGRVLLDPGDPVIVGEPTYLGIFTALATYRPSYHGVPMDEEGILTDVLEEELKSLRKAKRAPKFIYVVPTFHNPLGTTMSQRRRRRLADLSAEYGVPVLEDDPYYDLRFEGQDVPPIAAIQHDSLVIYVSSFSKILAPGFRIGFASGPAELINKMALAKQGVDVFTNAIGQKVAERYLVHGMLDRHLPRIRELYRHKKDVMMEAMEEHFPAGVEWTRPQGGMFLWVTLSNGVDTKALLPKAADRGVIYVPGHGFFAGRPRVNHMRLNYSFPSEPNIRKGISTLGKVLAESGRAGKAVRLAVGR